MSLRPKATQIFSFLLVLLFGVGLIWGARLTAVPIKQAKFSTTEANPNFNSLISAGVCGPWQQVNTNGFGLPPDFDQFNQPIKPISEKPFQGEEGFEVLVFNSQLYLGMEADNILGARLWRTRLGVAVPQTQLDWEEVAADRDKLPFGVNDTAQADHIDSLAEFQGWIYASLANRSGSPQGTLVFRSPSGNPETWENALTSNGPGFGKSQNENFKDMQVFDGHLCGGTWNEVDGAEVWCTSDGTNWQQKNLSGFGDSQNRIIWSGHVFDGGLYFGVQFTSKDEGFSQGRLYRTRSLNGNPIWKEVFQTSPGISWGNILGDLDGYLYISVPSPNGMLVYRSSSGDTDTWEIASLPGFDNTPANWGVVADGATVYQGALYAGAVNGQSNFTIWRTNGKPENQNSTIVSWEEIPLTGITDFDNLYVQLISFNGILYAWTSNPISGQQVWRVFCGSISK